ncbi:MAG: class I SAM-dependent methyltransferase [Candidatus Levyibacteriota bacterium]
MKNYGEINRKWWNNITPVHASSKFYGLPSFLKGKTSLQRTEIEEVGSVKGKTMLHLLCHFGMDSLSWARRGAKVTGVDISDESIRQARKLAKETKLDAKFIRSDIFDLPEVLGEKFDIIFCSYGVLLWLPSMKKFSKLINQYLKPGGFFYIVEVHPFTNILSYDFKLFYKYFKRGPYIEEDDGSYVDWSKDMKGVTYEWSHTISDLINSLIEQNLKLEFVHEFPFTMYDQFPGFMEKNKKGLYVLKNKKVEIPLLFSLKASKISDT